MFRASSGPLKIGSLADLTAFPPREGTVTRIYRSGVPAQGRSSGFANEFATALSGACGAAGIKLLGPDVMIDFCNVRASNLVAGYRELHVVIQAQPHLFPELEDRLPSYRASVPTWPRRELEAGQASRNWSDGRTSSR
jgi:hypothetical protein